MVFPADRLSCFKCSGAKCSENNDLKAEVCFAYKTDDECVSQFEGCKKFYDKIDF